MRQLYLIHIFALCLLFVGCGHNSEIDRQMDAAEGLMLSAPDSSLLILDRIYVGDLSDKKQKARYALLKSMALDKNYIDTTTFDVLQPAIDYYLDHGTPDEKLRTYYYEGRIHQNAERNEEAMRSFLKGLDLNGEITDSLTLANLFVAQGVLFYKSYMMEDVYRNALKSADIYEALKLDDRMFGSRLTAFHVSMIMNDSLKADSLLSILKQNVADYPEYKQELSPEENIYVLRFGSIDERTKILTAAVSDTTLSRDYLLNYALGSVEIDEPGLALQYFSSVDSTSISELSRMKYLIIGAEVYKSNGNFKQAFEYIWNYQVESDRITQKSFETKSKVTQEKHEQERESYEKLHRRDRWIIISIIIIAILLAIFLATAYRLHISKSKREKSELECERQTLIAENLRHRISQLEAEAETLKGLAKNNKASQSPVVSSVIKQRIEMLNGIIATSISNNDKYSKPYREWIDKEIADKKKFMDSTRLAFKSSHPAFVAYLEEHGLDEYEINYLCLYAIGLKGKEVGNYMELRRHYNISSEIRRKLGIDEHETNIGIYVMKLLKQL